MTLEEETVRKVVSKYLEKNRLHFKLSKGAGPDIIKEGGIVLEVKGSRVKDDLPGTLKQLTNYAFSYANLELAIPVAVLSLQFIYALFGIEAGIHFYTLGRQRSKNCLNSSLLLFTAPLRSTRPSRSFTSRYEYRL